jgi:hypothetical protein
MFISNLEKIYIYNTEGNYFQSPNSMLTEGTGVIVKL